MEKKALFKKIGSFLLDICEIYLPSVAFSIMFVVFVIQIFFRYFLNHPLTWPQEVTIFGFIWTAILGACFAKRHNVHVVFDLIYEAATPKTQLCLRLIGNGLIVAAFLIALKPSYEYVQFMSFQKSSVLRIPFNIAFFPYVIFVILILGRTLYDLVIDLRMLFKRGTTSL
jgi:TRAP-type C4-dicarboxylate transport system permease small subunit